MDRTFKPGFSKTEQRFAAKLEADANAFATKFDSVIVVERVDIPPQYGLVTYDQNRTITVT